MQQRPAAQRKALGSEGRQGQVPKNYWPAKGDRFVVPVWYTFVCVASSAHF